MAEGWVIGAPCSSQHYRQRMEGKWRLPLTDEKRRILAVISLYYIQEKA
jgi:hypothetical protein